jgi:hypothetical protein
MNHAVQTATRFRGHGEDGVGVVFRSLRWLCARLISGQIPVAEEGDGVFAEVEMGRASSVNGAQELSHGLLSMRC